MGFTKINFFSEPGWFRTLYISSEIWQGVGYGSIIYLAAITGVDQELYEAARIDGANRVQNIWHITIPCLIPTISILFIMRVGSIISMGFEKVYLMYSSATYETADVISTYVYRMGLMSSDPNISYATAVGLINSVVSLILVWGANAFSRRFLEESLW
jgi:putative aldouronate transport system permease protein